MGFVKKYVLVRLDARCEMTARAAEFRLELPCASRSMCDVNV